MEKVALSLSPGSLVTILGLLKNFYDSEIFSELIKEYYNTDTTVSVAAIRASASLGNEVSIPHLYKILEKGNNEQQLAAIDALAEIRAPSSVDVLYKNFNTLTINEQRLHIINALNKILPTHEKVRQLNRQLVDNTHLSADLRASAVKGLLETGDIDAIKKIARAEGGRIREEIIAEIIGRSEDEVGAFLGDFDGNTQEFSAKELGLLLCAYIIHVKRPENKYILEKVKKGKLITVRALLHSLLRYEGKFSYPLNIFKTLLILPYYNNDTEACNGKCLEKIVAFITDEQPFQINELSVITLAHLEALFNNVKKNFISVSNVTQKEMLLMVVLANLLERYGNEVLLLDLKEYLRGSMRFTRAELVENIRIALKDATEEEKYRFHACLPLMNLQKKSRNMQVINVLNRIDFNRPFKLRRLNRFIRLAGLLKVKTVIKLLQSILAFARKEHIPFLEETSVVTLCQLYDKTTVDEAQAYFSHLGKNLSSLKGYIRGARFLAPGQYIRNLVDLLLKSSTPDEVKKLTLDSLQEMELHRIKGIYLVLLRLVVKAGLKPVLRQKLGEIITACADPGVFQFLLDLTAEKDAFLKSLAVKTLGHVARRNKNMPREPLISRFYTLLDDPDNGIRQEALVALIALGDDYATEVLGDYFKGKMVKEAPAVLHKLEHPFSNEVISLLLKAVVINNEPLQNTLREVLEELVNGRYAEQIRNVLLEILKRNRENSLTAVERQSAGRAGETTVTEQSKKEFIFKRENTQILTVFFIDIAHYTEKSSLIDTTALMSLIQAFEGIVIPIIRRFNGTLIKTMGDGMLAVFKHPLNAILAGLEIQIKIAAYDQFKVEQEKFQVRVGINTGVVIRKQGDIFGDVVNIASRMETAANPGDIMITYSTYNEIKPYARCTELGKLNIKGIHEPMTAYLVQGMKPEYSYLPQVDEPGNPPVSEAQESETVEGLKQSLFSPRFLIPEHLQFGKELLQDVGERFGQISTAVEEIVWDYQEEYEFKKYLQQKWDELLQVWQKHDAGPGRSTESTVL